MSTIKKTALSLAISSSILLSACGGGGSSSGPQDPPSSSRAGVVEGSVIKGLLKDAVVKAYELNDRGDRVRQVGQGTSNQEGRYSLELSTDYKGGAIEIEVESAANTKMLCDAVDGCGSALFGQEIPVPVGFKMSALIPEAPKSAGEKLEAAVTPWSHMAAERAKKLIADGETAQAAASKATSETSEIVGFDISETKAADLSALGKNASAAEVKYAAANAALAAVLLADPSKIQEKLNQLAKSFEDGKFDDSDAIKIGEIKQGLKKVVESDQFAQIGNEEAANDLKNIEAKLPEAGEYDPEPVDEDLLTGSDVEKFKAFTKQARTWISTIQGTNFDTPLEALAVDVETVQQALGDDAIGVTQLLGEALGQVLDYLNKNPQAVHQALQTQDSLMVPIQNAEMQTLGNIEVDFATTSGVSLLLNGTLDGAQKKLTITGLTLATNVPASAFANGVFKSFESTQVEMHLSGKASTSLVTVDLKEVAVNVATSEKLTYSEALTDKAFEKAFKSASLTGEMEITHDQGSRFSGAVEVELVRLGSVQHPFSTASVKKFEVAGFFEGAKGSFDAKIALNVSNAAQFDTFGFLDHSEYREVHVQLPIEEVLLESMVSADTQNVVESMYSIYPDRGTAEGFRINRQSWSANGYLNRNLQIPAATLDQFKASMQALLAKAVDWEDNTPFAESASDFTLRSISFYGGDSFNVTMMAPPMTDLLGGGYQNSDLDGDGIPDSVYVWPYGNLVEIQLSRGEQYVDQVLNELSVSIPQNGIVRSISYDVLGGDYYNYVGIEVPASQEAYENCIAKPDAVLPELLLGSYYDYSSRFDSGYKKYLCLDHTLARSLYDGGAVISGAESAAIRGKLAQAVQSKYPNVEVEKLGYIWSYDFFLSDTHVDWEVDVEFGRFERDDYFLQGSLTLSAGLQLPELPKATVTATLNRTKLNGGDLSAAVQWDGGSYNVALSVEDVDAEVVPARAVISNSVGHRLVLNTTDATADKVKLTGEAFVGSNKVGNVETTDKGLYVIRYTDGTFETLY